MKFWMLTLVPWVIFLALSFEAVEHSLRNRQVKFSNGLSRALRFVPLLAGILVLSINMRSGVLSQHSHQSEDNIAFHQAMDIWLGYSNPNDVLITAGDLVPHCCIGEIEPGR